MVRETVMSKSSETAEIAIAANATLMSLLRTLVDKEILSNADVRALLARAAHDIEPRDVTAPATGAAGIILDDMLPRFPEDGGD
jgi:hypothetical protein